MTSVGFSSSGARVLPLSTPVDDEGEEAEMEGGLVRRWSVAERSWMRWTGIGGFEVEDRRELMTLRLRKGEEKIGAGIVASRKGS